MDNETLNSSEKTFKRELGEAFALSAASTAGFFAGIIIIGSLVGRNQKKIQKASDTEVPTITDMK